ncbi:MAG: PTS sugar transporter subunit IIB [Armatimonadota bacterium]
MNILLICSGGMSTSFITQKMVKAAQEKNLELKIDSASAENLEDVINNYDIVLVAPQVKYRYDRLKEVANNHSKPIALIDGKLYGTMNGEGILKQAEDMLGAGK